MKSRVDQTVGMLRLNCMSFVLAASLFGLVSCARPSAQLEVLVVTSLVPGPEFGLVETAVMSGGVVVDTVDARALPNRTYALGQRVAGFELANGEYVVRVRLQRRDGSFVVQQNVRISISGNYVLRVHITRDCVGVQCPGAGSPELTACLAGRCVDPRCSLASPEFCPDISFCADATQCPATAECADARCDEGVCVEQAIAERCAEGEWCNPSAGAGCVPTEMMESGVACGTICASDALCRVGYWRCEEGRDPVCTDLFTRVPGFVCAPTSVCDAVGDCVSCAAGAPCRVGCALGAVSCASGSPACALLDPPTYLDEGSPCSSEVCFDGEPCETSGTCDASGACEPTPIESAGFVWDALTALMSSEAGATASAALSLAAAPTADVTVSVMSSDVTEGVVAPSSLVFTPANWATPQMITLTGVDDAIADGSQMYTVRVSASSADARYASLAPSDRAAVNIDDDAPGVTVVPTAGLTCAEGGGVTSFELVLNTEPVADVSFALHSTDAGEGEVVPTTIQFTTADWSMPQTVVVNCVDDFVVDGDQLFTVVVDAAASDDVAYAGIDPTDVTVTNQDDDTASFLVTPTSGLVTTESGAGTAFSIALSSQPSASVTVSLSSSDTSEGTVSPSVFVFTTSTWNLAQIAIVTGVDDMIADGDQVYSVVTASAFSADPNYNGVDPVDVSVTNTDDDVAAVIVAPVSGLMTSESGASTSFTVRLQSMPTASVTVPISSSDLTEGTVSPASLTFTTANWSTPQTVNVTGVNDVLFDGNQSYNAILAMCVSADPVYAAINPSDVSITNIDTTACTLPTILCGGSCVSCPSDYGVLTTGCSGSVCVATSCIPWYETAGGTCRPSQAAYLKASNPDSNDYFGVSLAISGDGHTIAAGSPSEASNATGVNGNQLNNSAAFAGAVYVFREVGSSWMFDAYIKASNTDPGDRFSVVSLSEDGSVMAVGANQEASGSQGINGAQTNFSTGIGAVYLFRRIGSNWVQEAYIKASNAGPDDSFGRVALSADGNVLVVGAGNESSNATGVNGNQLDNSAAYAGAVYVFRYAASAWSQEAYIKASNTEAGDSFGSYLALSGDGNVIVAVAPAEDSNARGIGGNQLDNSSSNSGAAYVFRRNAGVWSQEAYIKTSNADPNDYVGPVGVSFDGNRFVVSTLSEQSSATGVGGNQMDNSIMQAGAAYVFERVGMVWSQIAYLKGSRPESNYFGRSVAMSYDGATVVVGADYESTPTAPFGHSGRLHVFHDAGSGFALQADLSGLNADAFDFLGSGVSISGDGTRIVGSASNESSNASGVDGDASNNALPGSGAVYLFER